MASGTINYDIQKKTKLSVDSINTTINTRFPEIKKNVIGAGWYRFAKYNGGSFPGVKGNDGNSVMIIIKTFYGSGGNTCDFILLNSAYESSNFTVLGSHHLGDNISKIRHVIDTENNIAYLEFYYNHNSDIYDNPVSVELYSTYSATKSIKWELMGYEKTEETVANTTVYSIADLVTKDRNLITNSDIKLSYVEGAFRVTANIMLNLTTCTSELLAGSNAPKNPNYIPVIVGHNTTSQVLENIMYDPDGSWRYYGNTSQNVTIRFYKV